MSPLRFGVAALVLVLVLWAGTCFLFPSPSPPVEGPFTALSALFSGLAFAAVIATLLLQRAELSLQRDELAATREELAGQKEQLRQQNLTLRQQAFDNTFFHLLRLHGEIVASIYLRLKAGFTSSGRDCFKVFVGDLRNHFTPQSGVTPALSAIQAAYDNFYRDRQQEVGHYFRSLYNMVKFVDRSELSDKRLYTNLIRAQLSAYELVLLFYNCLSPYGNERFRPLVATYALLKHLDVNLLFSPTHVHELPAAARGL